MLEIKVENGHVRQKAEGDVQRLAFDVLCAISAVHNSVRDRDPFLASLFQAIVTAGIKSDSPVWNDTRAPGGVHVSLDPEAGKVIKRVLEGGGSMTAIDLTRDQCAALANFLRRTVDRGMDSGYDEIELLVLAQRALRNAAKTVSDSLKELPNVIACDVPKSGTPEGGG